MNQGEFEDCLGDLCLALSMDLQNGSLHVSDSVAFETIVLKYLREALKGTQLLADKTQHIHAFPDLAANGFGVEVKFTKKDSWLSVGNSVFEGMRDPAVNRVYVVFGKMGGWPEVRWSRYEDCVSHVRISHAPRFVLEMEQGGALFDKMGVSYETFAELPPTEKMEHIRAYSRSRLKEGERLWWLEDQEEQVEEQQAHTWPAEVTFYMRLPQARKKRLRAEAVLLCPGIVKPSRTKTFEYADAGLYLLRQHGVFCHQTRDLFSAGSVAGVEGEGKYVMKALRRLEGEMKKAALEMDDQLFVEYWGSSCLPERRIAEWLRRADKMATDWTPSDYLFLTDDDE